MRIAGVGVLVALIAGVFGTGSAAAEFSVNTWGQFVNCPYENPKINDCFYGATSGGKAGGYFQYGKVKVKLSGSVVIQGGYEGAGTEILVYDPVSPAKLLESPQEPIVKGMRVITPEIQTLAEWPAALKKSFKEGVKNKETEASVTIEMAGNECTTVQGCLSTEALIFEQFNPPAFRLPLKVTVHNAWLEKLGGGPCIIGSDENPIKQNLITGGQGRSGDISFNEMFTETRVANSTLVDSDWHISQAQGPKGCGGEWESYVNKALAIALEVEGPNGFELSEKRGFTILKGTLYDGASGTVKEEHEKGNPELP